MSGLVPCENDDCFEIISAAEISGMCRSCWLEASFGAAEVVETAMVEVAESLCMPPSVFPLPAERSGAPEPTPEPQAPPKARRAPRKAATAKTEADWKALYELASQNIRAMVVAGGCIPGVMPKCSCPHCPDSIACASEQIGPMTSLQRQGEDAFVG